VSETQPQGRVCEHAGYVRAHFVHEHMCSAFVLSCFICLRCVMKQAFDIRCTAAVFINVVIIILLCVDQTSWWTGLTLPLREVPGSNLVPLTGYPEIIFAVFLSPYRQFPCSTLKLRQDRLLENRFQFIMHASSFHSMLYIQSYRRSVVR
jgi:hypothetical protein